LVEQASAIRTRLYALATRYSASWVRARTPGCPSVKRAAAMGDVLRHMRRHLLIVDGGDARASVVRLVRTQRPRMKTAQLGVVQELRHHIPLGGASGVC
jgi:hypothetical protein